MTWWDGDDCHNVDVWEDEAAMAAFGKDRRSGHCQALRSAS
jgi:hypothetical protein